MNPILHPIRYIRRLRAIRELAKAVARHLIDNQGKCPVVHAREMLKLTGPPATKYDYFNYTVRVTTDFDKPSEATQ